MKHIIIASNNAHKIEEICAAINFDGWGFVSLAQAHIDSEPEETATSFEGNAEIKARAVHELTGNAVLADDSGLEVDALDGAPGVLSARFAGVHGDDAANNKKLLECLSEVEPIKRTARFVCALVFIDEDGSISAVRGTVEGRIGLEERGNEGFGYDPLFFPVDLDGKRSFAEMTQEEKTAISHRGRALKKLRELLQEKGALQR